MPFVAVEIFHRWLLQKLQIRTLSSAPSNRKESLSWLRKDTAPLTSAGGELWKEYGALREALAFGVLIPGMFSSNVIIKIPLTGNINRITSSGYLRLNAIRIRTLLKIFHGANYRSVYLKTITRQTMA